MYTRCVVLYSAIVACNLSPVEDPEFASILVALCAAFKEKLKKKKPESMGKDWLQTHGHCGLRMNEEVFIQLQDMVAQLIEKKGTTMRAPISPTKRLSLTLCYLGNSFEDLQFSSFIVPTTISKLTLKTSEALCLCLKDYIKVSKLYNHVNAVGVIYYL